MSNTPRILIVEDELALATALKEALEESGYESDIATDGVLATEFVDTKRFGLVLLDVMLPSKNGFEVLRHIRGNGHKMPVIFLTAMTDQSHSVLGLDLGADDYVAKPFRLEELLARVRAQLRRSEMFHERYQVGDLLIDSETQSAVRADRTIYLSQREFSVVLELARAVGKPVSKSDLLERVSSGTARGRWEHAL